MVIVLGFYKRKPGLTHEEFSRHWSTVHGPLIMSLPDIDKYIVRYVQHHLSPEDTGSTVTASPESGEAEGYDGSSETWFVDEKARNRLFETDAVKETHSDEEKFLDMKATRWIVRDSQISFSEVADWNKVAGRLKGSHVILT